MTFSANSSASALALAGCIACATARPAPAAPAASARVAVLPVENLAASAAPLKDVRAALEGALRDRGIAVVPTADVEAFLARHRIRWTGGVDSEAAHAAAVELSATSLLVSAVDLYQSATSPSFGLRARLVSTGTSAAIQWIDARGHIGDEAPGLFELGIVNDVAQLQQRTIAELTESLARWVAGAGPRTTTCDGGGRFAPQASYRLPQVAPGARVAVLPFVNETIRRDAGTLVALDFVRHLEAAGRTVIEPGLVREQLLQFRIGTNEAVSLDVARVIMEVLGADFLLTGTVRDYLGTSTAQSTPVVQFTAMILERKNDEIVWEASSYHRGDEGVFFFDAGHVDTAPALSCRMVRSAVDAMLRDAKTHAPTQILRPSRRP